MVQDAVNSPAMNWKALIESLMARGITMSAIAESVGAPLSTISEIVQGRTKEPRAGLGLALLALCDRHKKAA